MARTYQIHPIQISQGKKQLLDGVESLFHDGRRCDRDDGQGPSGRALVATGTTAKALQAELYQQIGRLNMELEWRKKGLPAPADRKRSLIDHNYPHLSIHRQCELLDLNRSSFSLSPATESEAELAAVEHAGGPVLSGGVGRGVVVGSTEIFNTDQDVQFPARATPAAWRRPVSR